MANILYVSKPLVPPWNDSNKNLVRDLAGSLVRHSAWVLGCANSPAIGRATIEPLFRASTGFALSRGEAARVVARLLWGARPDIMHFFFAPNPRTSRIANATSRWRGVPTVQTVASVPHEKTDLNKALFADRIVVLSERTERMLRDAHVSNERMMRIPPCVPELPRSTPKSQRDARARLQLPLESAIVLFPGDLEFDGGASLLLHAMHAIRDAHPEAMLVFATRPKTAEAQRAEKRLRALAGPHVRFFGNTPEILSLLEASSVVALPAQNLYAKMDYPLVLLEAMMMGKPVLVSTGSSASELATAGGALATSFDVAAIGEGLRSLLGEFGTTIGNDAAKDARARFHPAAMARRYESLYDELLRGTT